MPQRRFKHAKGRFKHAKGGGESDLPRATGNVRRIVLQYQCQRPFAEHAAPVVLVLEVRRECIPLCLRAQAAMQDSVPLAEKGSAAHADCVEQDLGTGSKAGRVLTDTCR